VTSDCGSVAATMEQEQALKHAEAAVLAGQDELIATTSKQLDQHAEVGPPAADADDSTGAAGILALAYYQLASLIQSRSSGRPDRGALQWHRKALHLMRRQSADPLARPVRHRLTQLITEACRSNGRESPLLRQQVANAEMHDPLESEPEPTMNYEDIHLLYQSLSSAAAHRAGEHTGTRLSSSSRAADFLNNRATSLSRRHSAHHQHSQRAPPPSLAAHDGQTQNSQWGEDLQARQWSLNHRGAQAWDVEVVANTRGMPYAEPGTDVAFVSEPPLFQSSSWSDEPPMRHLNASARPPLAQNTDRSWAREKMATAGPQWTGDLSKTESETESQLHGDGPRIGGVVVLPREVRPSALLVSKPKRTRPTSSSPKSATLVWRDAGFDEPEARPETRSKIVRPERAPRKKTRPASASAVARRRRSTADSDRPTPDADVSRGRRRAQKAGRDQAAKFDRTVSRSAAAIRIQKVARGHFARAHTQQLRALRRLSKVQRRARAAAVTLQSRARGVRVRDRVAQKRKALSRRQEQQRTKTAEEAAASVVQGLYRASTARRAVEQRKRFLAHRQQTEAMHAAAMTLSRFLVAQRARLVAQRLACVERRTRRLIEERQAEDLAAVQIQALFRGAIAKREIESRRRLRLEMARQRELFEAMSIVVERDAPARAARTEAGRGERNAGKAETDGFTAGTAETTRAEAKCAEAKCAEALWQDHEVTAEAARVETEKEREVTAVDTSRLVSEARREAERTAIASASAAEKARQRERVETEKDHAETVRGGVEAERAHAETVMQHEALAGEARRRETKAARDGAKQNVEQEVAQEKVLRAEAGENQTLGKQRLDLAQRVPLEQKRREPTRRLEAQAQELDAEVCAAVRIQSELRRALALPLAAALRATREIDLTRQAEKLQVESEAAAKAQRLDAQTCAAVQIQAQVRRVLARPLVAALRVWREAELTRQAEKFRVEEEATAKSQRETKAAQRLQAQTQQLDAERCAAVQIQAQIRSALLRTLVATLRASVETRHAPAPNSGDDGGLDVAAEQLPVQPLSSNAYDGGDDVNSASSDTPRTASQSTGDWSGSRSSYDRDSAASSGEFSPRSWRSGSSRSRSSRYSYSSRSPEDSPRGSYASSRGSYPSSDSPDRSGSYTPRRRSNSEGDYSYSLGSPERTAVAL